MPDALKGTMQGLTGETEPLAQAVVLGDRGYVSEANLREGKERKIEVLIPDQQFRSRGIKAEEKGSVQPKQGFAAEDCAYNKKKDRYGCPENNVLEHQGRMELQRNRGKRIRRRAKIAGTARRGGVG